MLSFNTQPNKSTIAMSMKRPRCSTLMESDKVSAAITTAPTQRESCFRFVSAVRNTLVIVLLLTTAQVESLSTITPTKVTLAKSSSATSSSISSRFETLADTVHNDLFTSKTIDYNRHRTSPYYTNYEEDIDEDEYDDDDEDEDDHNDAIRGGIQRYQTLVHSTGSEIVQTELQKQIQMSIISIDDTNKNNNQKLDQFILQYHNANDKNNNNIDTTDLNEMEYIAMHTLPEQLPATAIRSLTKNTVLSKEKKQRIKIKKQSVTSPSSVAEEEAESKRKAKVAARRTYNQNNLNYKVNGRVSVEEEIYLAQMIQLGVQLQNAKQQLIDEKQAAGIDVTDISRNEWAAAVQMTPKQLRQTLSAIRTAKHQLVTANIGLVHSVVKQFCHNAKAAGISTEELVQEGSIGLLRAAELFNPDRGVRFSTYAVVWIKGILSNSHITEIIRVPSREKTKYNKIKKAQSDLYKMNLGNNELPNHISNGSIEELASMTGLSVHEIIDTQRKMNHISNIYSLDYEQKMHTRSGSESSIVESTMTSSSSTSKNQNTMLLYDDDDFVQQMQLQTDIIATMARNLDPREARLMRLRYGLSYTGNDNADNADDNDSSVAFMGGRTLQECADAMGLSYSRVHQLNERCLKKLRTAAEAESLEEYLLTIA